MNNATLQHLLKKIKTDRRAKPSPEFKRNARIRILNHVGAGEEMPAVKSPMRIRSMGLIYLKFAALFIIMLFIVSGSVVYTASFSQPGSSLYPVKTATYRVLHREQPTVAKEEATPSGNTNEAQGTATPSKMWLTPTGLPTQEQKQEGTDQNPVSVPPAASVPATTSPIPSPTVTPTVLPVAPTDVLGVVSTVIPSPPLETPSILPKVPPIIP